MSGFPRARELWLLLIPLVLAGQEKLRITVAEYEAKVYASWVGQCVGNIYGLAHEQRYFFEPGPSTFPLGYSGWGAARMKQLNGAFSDDDTDIEYMYLLAVEKHGVEPTYGNLAELWQKHVRREVWLGNRAALGAMRFGFTPPWTGKKGVNPHWFQIDPQLVNEIWGVTAPGMVRYAAAKSGWAARVMSDDWATEPTIVYGAMYAAAFFERDTRKLLEIGRAALPRNSRFAQTIEEMERLHAKYPNDWKAARREAAQKYGFGEPAATRTGTNANLNGAMGILALLYGGGDFWKTLDVACALGFDADNQAATMAGLLGVAQGIEGIPRELMFPYPELGWSEPLNDRYSNVTRENLPNGTLRDIAARMAALGGKVIERAGGQRRNEGGTAVYEINRDAVFAPPFEFPTGPLPVIEAGVPVDHELLAVCAAEQVSWRLASGRLPGGLRFDDGRLMGTAQAMPGVYLITVEVRCGSETLRRAVKLVVRGVNQAREAERIIAPVERPDVALIQKIRQDTPATFFAPSVEAMRDGKRAGEGASVTSLGAGTQARSDAYGYEWARPRSIGLVALTTGFLEETTGWFERVKVQFRDEAGEWRDVEGLQTYPPFPEGPAAETKAHFAEYLLFFRPVDTRAVRVTGPVAGSAKNMPVFTSISELGVYGPVAGTDLLAKE